jgi:hypothetical protein
VLASLGQPFSDAAIARAAREANGGTVRVVTIARIHGFAFGLQHPGLMPNKKEKDAAQQVVSDAIRALQQKGLKADGEVVITRSPGRACTRAARAAKTVAHVVLDGGAGPLQKLEAALAARYTSLMLRVPVTRV